MRITSLKPVSLIAVLMFFFLSCSKDQPEELEVFDLRSASNTSAHVHNPTIIIENVLDSRPLVESGSFMGEGTPPVIFPGQEISFSFYAGPGQFLSFATMYGWSNDLFFAPENPGIQLYENGVAIEGDISSQIKLWDNGTRKNQPPGMDVVHPGVPEEPVKAIKEVAGTDDYGNSYPAASEMMKLHLEYNGHSQFTLSIMNNSDQTTNATPFSPGVWAISYVAGGEPLLPDPIVQEYTTEGLTNIAETGDITVMHEYLSEQTGIFTPLSPILVVVYRGNENPFYEVGEYDRGEGLEEIAKFGAAGILAENLQDYPNVENVYILAEPATGVLLPRVGDNPGGRVSQELEVTGGSKIAIATMYGFSNDWFFATSGNDVNALRKGDVSASIKLFDNGTAVDEFPGAGASQAAFGGTPDGENEPIWEVPNPNEFTTLPPIQEIIQVTLK